MTPKDIRDIAAYWGAEFTYVDTRAMFQSEAGSIDGWSLDEIATLSQKSPEIQTPQLKDFKLHLRPLSSLTDEEVQACFTLAFPAHKPNQPIVREVNSFFAVYSATFDDIGQEDLTLRLGWEHGHYQAYFAPEYAVDSLPFAVCAYLQSIGVYVPGTIDEQYVQLIN